MTIGVGAVSTIVIGGPTVATTVGINTQASGSNFFAAVTGNGVNATTPPTITDNKGNSWPPPLAAALNNTNNDITWRFELANGVGGLGHTITSTFAGAVNNHMACLLEQTLPALLSPLDQSAVGTTGASTGPALSGTLALNPPATSELLIAIITVHDGSTNLTFVEANGFFIQASQQSFTASSTQWAIATKVVAAPGNYSASWTWGGVNIFVSACIDSFLGPGGPPQVAYNPRLQGPSLSAPFNPGQFKSFPYSAVFQPIPLSLSLGSGTYNLTGQPINLTLGPLPPNVTVRQITKSGGRVVLPSKKLGETITYNFDFISALVPGETIQSATVKANVWSGTDPAPGAIVSGGATITGTKVANNITGGVLGVIYFVTCAATTSLNQIIELAGYLAIVPDVP